MKSQKTSLEWLSTLVAFDTTSRNSNLDLIAEIQAYFADVGLESRLTRDAAGKKANIFATLPAENGTSTGGLVLSGHTDVVPVDGQIWDSNPFQATVKEGRVYGRGTADMKGFIAVVLAMLPEFKKMKRAKPLHFAFSYDEEVGCHGAAVMIDDLVKQGIQPEGCIVGEPTELRPVVAHKGIHLFRCRVQGKAAHSSLTSQGCNAIDYAARLICHLRTWAEQIKQTGPCDGHYDVPFTTLSTNQIQGGNAYNTIPAFCEFFFEFRNLPTVDPQTILSPIQHYLHQELLPKMRADYPAADFQIEALAAVPAFEAAETAPFTQFLRTLCEEKQTLKVAYATEAGLFQKAGIPTLLCGPGSIEQAHRANEYLELSELKRCEIFLKKLAQALSENHPFF